MNVRDPLPKLQMAVKQDLSYFPAVKIDCRQLIFHTSAFREQSSWAITPRRDIFLGPELLRHLRWVIGFGHRQFRLTFR